MKTFVLAVVIAVGFLALTVFSAEYGQFCNGLIEPCNRYNETVLCMYREETTEGEPDYCEVGIDVDIGRCQCRRNCGANNTYQLEAEFDEERQICVGFVGVSCQIWSSCTKNAYCEPVTRVCECVEGFVPDEEGLRCVEA